MASGTDTDRVAVISHQDITARKLMEFELKKLAETDELTGLKNRRKCLASAEKALGVQSRHLMDQIDDESTWLRSPPFADELVWREALEGLQAATEIVGVDEIMEVSAQLIVTVVVEALDGGVLDGPVHALDLAVGPRMIDLREPVLDAVLAASHVEHVGHVSRAVGPLA